MDAVHEVYVLSSTALARNYSREALAVHRKAIRSRWEEGECQLRGQTIQSGPGENKSNRKPPAPTTQSTVKRLGAQVCGNLCLPSVSVLQQLLLVVEQLLWAKKIRKTDVFNQQQHPWLKLVSNSE